MQRPDKPLRGEPLGGVISRYVYALVPLGFGMWLAHYSFHFLTGGLTLVPVVQSFLADVGLFGGRRPVGVRAGGPRRMALPHRSDLPVRRCVRLDKVVALQIAKTVWEPRKAVGLPQHEVAAPWIMLTLLLLVAGLAILVQPMEMRGTLLMSGAFR